MAVALVGTALCDLFFVTETERISRRVRAFVPRSRVRAFLITPFLPGGGRGLLLLLLHAGMIAAAMSVVAFAGSVHRPGTHREHTGFALIVFTAFVVHYLALPSLVASRSSANARTRLLTRVLIPVIALLAGFLPNLLGFLVGNEAWLGGRHLLDPFWVVIRGAFESDEAYGYALVATGSAALVLLMNLPRLVDGVREVLTASAERDRAARASVAPPEARHAA